MSVESCIELGLSSIAKAIDGAHDVAFCAAPLELEDVNVALYEAMRQLRFAQRCAELIRSRQSAATDHAAIAAAIADGSYDPSR